MLRRPVPASFRGAHEIGFEIYGDEMQFVEVELDPGETAIAEAGGMMFLEPGIEIQTIFGDGSMEGERAPFSAASATSSAGTEISS